MATSEISSSRDAQVELAKMGVKMNYVAAQISPAFYCISPKEVAANIRAVGVENALISTDVGQKYLLLIMSP